VSLISPVTHDVPLAFCTRLIIFDIFSSSYGKVETFDVKVSLVSTLGYVIKHLPQAHELTYATMR
jgi:hypothetical protein